MSKHEVLAEILEMYDLVGELERENESLRRSQGTLGMADAHCLRVGRKAVFERHTYSYTGCMTCPDGKVETLESYKARITVDVPDTMSRAEFYDYFDDEYRRLYTQAVGEATEKRKEATDGLAE